MSVLILGVSLLPTLGTSCTQTVKDQETDAPSTDNDTDSQTDTVPTDTDTNSDIDTRDSLSGSDFSTGGPEETDSDRKKLSVLIEVAEEDVRTLYDGDTLDLGLLDQNSKFRFSVRIRNRTGAELSIDDIEIKGERASDLIGFFLVGLYWKTSEGGNWEDGALGINPLDGPFSVNIVLTFSGERFSFTIVGEIQSNITHCLNLKSAITPSLSPADMSGFVPYGNRFIVTTTYGGIYSIIYRDPSSLMIEGTLEIEDIDTPNRSLALHDQYAFVSSSWGIKTIDISDPTSIKQLRRYSHGLEAKRIIATDRLLFAHESQIYTDEDEGIIVYDLPDDILSMTYIYVWLNETGAQMVDFGIRDSILFVLTRSELLLLDITDIETLLSGRDPLPMIGTVPLDTMPGKITIAGDYVYLLETEPDSDQSQIEIIDITIPATASSVSVFQDTTRNIKDMMVEGTDLYTIGGGLHRYDLSSPTRPVYIDTLTNFFNSGPKLQYIDDTHVFVGDYWDLFILPRAI